MTLEPINDFFSNIKEKLTNPFFGTLIFVWLVRNWELVYSIFNFDKCYTLETKKQFIVSYYSNKTIGNELFINIGIALLLMFLGYIMLFLTRTFTTWFDYSLTPWVTGKIISSKVIQKELYDEVKKERNEYAEKYEEQRKLVRESSKEYDELSNKFKEKSQSVTELSSQLNESNIKNNSLTRENNNFSTTISNLNKEVKKLNEDSNYMKDLQGFYELQNYQFNELIKDLTNNSNKSNEINIPVSIVQLKNILKKDKILSDFYSVAEFVLYGGKIDTSKIEALIKYKVVYKFNSTKEYRLTAFGNYLFNNWLFLSN